MPPKAGAAIGISHSLRRGALPQCGRFCFGVWGGRVNFSLPRWEVVKRHGGAAHGLQDVPVGWVSSAAGWRRGSVLLVCFFALLPGTTGIRIGSRHFTQTVVAKT